MAERGKRIGKIGRQVADPAAVISATLARLEARTAQIEARLARLEADIPAARLTDAIRAAAAGQWFTSGELVRLGKAEADAAQAEGRPRPELAKALEAAGIRGAHGLARWLAGRDDVERAGVLWHLS